MEPLCERVEFRDVSTKFYVQIFQHFKSAFKMKFKNREHMLPGAKTPLPAKSLS
jgi:hypothetical protein